MCWDNEWKQFIIVLEKIEDDGWRCWLQPQTMVNDYLQYRNWGRLDSEYQQFLTIMEERQPINQLEYTSALIESFRRIEKRFEESGKSEYFYRAIEQHFPHNKSLIIPKDEQQLAYTFYKALSLYLQRGDLYREIKAYTTLAFVVWQRYNLAKQLFKDKEIRTEIVDSYHDLTKLLSDPAFAHGFSSLWYYATSKSQGEKQDKKRTAPLYEYIRTRLQLSMFLDFKSPKIPHNLNRPMPAPLCFQHAKIPWRKLNLHQRFQEGDGKRAARAFIRDWLLPSYNLIKAFCLSWMLARENKKLPFAVRIFLLIGLFFGIFFFLSRYSMPQTFASLLQLSLPVIIAISLILLDWHSILDLLLPRILGGMFIGYLPLVLDKDPWLITTLVCEKNTYQLQWNGFLIILLFFSLISSFIYLTKEAFVYSNSVPRAIGRAGLVLVWAILVSAILGMWICEFVAPIPQSIDTNFEANGTQPPDFHPDWTGIMGQSIPVPALLTFSPLALFIGIIVQIIWEKKPVTATIWFSDEQ